MVTPSWLCEKIVKILCDLVNKMPKFIDSWHCAWAVQHVLWNLVSSHCQACSWQELPPDQNTNWRDLPEDIPTLEWVQGSSWTTEDWPQAKTSIVYHKASDHTNWETCYTTFSAYWAADQKTFKTTQTTKKPFWVHWCSKKQCWKLVIPSALAASNACKVWTM